MKRICTICARGGSKGVKNKNIRNLLGKPLIAHSILQAKATKLFDYISVSSDSAEILAVAKQYGADFLIERPDNLATDKAAKIPAIQHCLLATEKITNLKFDILVDLDATSPLRTTNDICETVGLIEEKKVSNILTAMPARRSPYFNLVELDCNNVVQLSKPLAEEISCRQDAPRCFDMNASIYVWTRDALLNNSTVFLKDTLLYVMPEERSIDIDTEIDFSFVEFLSNRRGTLL